MVVIVLLLIKLLMNVISMTQPQIKNMIIQNVQNVYLQILEKIQ